MSNPLHACAACLALEQLLTSKGRQTVQLLPNLQLMTMSRVRTVYFCIMLCRCKDEGGARAVACACTSSGDGMSHLAFRSATGPTCGTAVVGSSLRATASAICRLLRAGHHMLCAASQLQAPILHAQKGHLMERAQG